jgi:hypothetical protein
MQNIVGCRIKDSYSNERNKGSVFSTNAKGKKNTTIQSNFEQWTFDRLFDNGKIIYIITFCDNDFQDALKQKQLNENDLMCFGNGVFCKKSDWEKEYKNYEK